jgi:hypothetical protein
MNGDYQFFWFLGDYVVIFYEMVPVTQQTDCASNTQAGTK